MIRALILLPLLAACAPVPMTPEKAARLCRAEIGQADGISGSVGAGVSNGGPVARGSITVTNRVLNPQTEAEFLEDCIARRVAGKPEPTTFGVSIGRRT
ncbi:hypothetical protein SAMN05444004_11430 [Jannaschia faecimaris]|uniref:Lipoprotein n=1 Tax=Jannaschia faecimaris TaxID=1244108 RepID=A0A1H3SZS8_9RHOB|nr:hypothetical protein [Jannaschia faecimaris]SDZ42609.1 hypothetical protein SAMN05444004_11430 [Jannaschia faecimaris]